MHKLLNHQLRKIMQADGSVDAQALIAVVERTYVEFDRERRLNDRAARLMEEELQEANSRIRKLGDQRLAETLESVPSAIALLNADGLVQNMNSAMVTLCAGLDPPLRRGDKFIDIMGALSPKAANHLKDLLSGGTLEVEISGRWYLGAARRLSDGSYALALPEITALKEREATLALARDAAESANKLKSKFLATMSHELRTPLNAILGFSEIIRDCVLCSDEKTWGRYSEYAGSIHASGTHLLLLISEVLDLSKIESGSYHLHLEQFDIASLTRDSLYLIEPQARRGRVAILPLNTHGDMDVKADLRAVKQVIVNLLSNAVKFTAPGGEVEIGIAEMDGFIDLRVRDTGIGVAAEHLKSVFEPFHQGDAALARRYEGTGLGLSVCRGLVEMHGGSIALESKPAQGTTAIVRLPKQARVSAAAAVFAA